MASYTPLHGVKTVDKSGLIAQLQQNLIEYFDWGLLEAGGYTNVGMDSQYDAEDNTLLPVTIPNLPAGCGWQAIHRSWVWESGLNNSSGQQPIAVSGVYVNGEFHRPDSTDGYAHRINYPDGRVIFTNPLPSDSLVQATYSYKWTSFYDQSVSWFRDVIFDSIRFELGLDNSQPLGVPGLLKQNSIQLPAIVVESVPKRMMIPKQIGDLSQWVYQDFIFHIIADKIEDRDFLIDVISFQKDVEINMFDTNARRLANAFGLDWQGNKVVGGFNYPQTVNAFFNRVCRFSSIIGSESSIALPLYKAVVTITLNVDATMM